MSATRDTLMEAEHALQLAQLHSDADALEQLLHDDLAFVSPGGVVVGKADDVRLHRSGALDFRASNAIEIDAHVIGETGITLALIAVEVQADGQLVLGTYRYTRTWLFDDGRWQVIAGAVVAIGS
jgi:ketosteroid isomerase-like protein